MLWGLNTAFCEACGHEGPQANRTQASARHEQARIQECNSAYTRCGLYADYLQILHCFFVNARLALGRT